MNEYEIRISSKTPGALLIWASPHPSTFSALCTARGLAGDGDILEVWRGVECVHREIIAAPPPSP